MFPLQNNKDYFDQSLDEIRLLQYINSADPADEHNILRLYDFFYFKVGAGYYLKCHLVEGGKVVFVFVCMVEVATQSQVDESYQNE